MRKWLLGMAVVALALAPLTSRADGPVLKYAAGKATAAIAYGWGTSESYSMTGSFRIGKSAYRGTVTGHWSIDFFTGALTSSFSGSDGGHSFAATCNPNQIPIISSPIGIGPPGPAAESLTCQVSIDGSAPARLIIAFVWATEEQVQCSRCDAFAYKGVFAGAL